MMMSAVSGHKKIRIRERLADKLEVIAFDPYSKYAANQCLKSGVARRADEQY